MTANGIMPYKQAAHEHTWQTLIEFDLFSEAGGERLAVDRVTEAVQRLNWPAAHLKQLKPAFAQATRNTIERSRLSNSAAPLIIRVLIPENARATWEVDQAGGEPTEHQVAEKLVQPVDRPPALGWGFFLIEKAVPGPDCGERHLLELFLYPGGK